MAWSAFRFMQVGLHQFHADTIQWLSGAVLEEEGCTRSSLARDLCALEDWTGDRGAPCLASARKVLPVLADRLGRALPVARTVFGRGRCEDTSACPELSLRCRLSNLGAVTLALVDGDAAAVASDDGEAPPARLSAGTGRATALLGLFLASRLPRRHRVLRRELASEGARRLRWLVDRRADCEPLASDQQPPLPASARRARSRPGLASAGAGYPCGAGAGHRLCGTGICA
ncbi:MAG: hypothetical protein OXD42_00020 [Rhodospirillaceae bacterium]|nr:hypothetical protein [Rhodospirillaceae bacterium]